MAKSGSKTSSRFISGAGIAATGITLLLLAGAVVGTGMTYQKLERRAGDAGAAPVNLVIEWPPLEAPGKHSADGQPATWLSEPYQFQIMAITKAALTDDPYDSAALERAGQALVSTGWVKSVRAIRREPGGVVRVTAEWRTPAAVVRYHDTDYLVSSEGDLLPAEFKPGQTKLRAIVNPSFGPPEHPGDRWVGGDVQAGLVLLAQLQAHPKAYQQVAGIDVERYVKARKLAAVTDRGSLVVWGVPPGESRVGEPGTEKKLALLDRLLADPAYGKRIDANQPLVDLTSPRGILIDASARPLVMPRADEAEDEGEPAPASDTIAATAPRPGDE